MVGSVLLEPPRDPVFEVPPEHGKERTCSRAQSWHASTPVHVMHVSASNLRAIATSMTGPQFRAVSLSCTDTHMYTNCSGMCKQPATQGNWTYPPVFGGIPARCCIDEDEIRTAVASNRVPESIRQPAVHREHASGTGLSIPSRFGASASSERP